MQHMEICLLYNNLTVHMPKRALCMNVLNDPMNCMYVV